MRRFKFTTEKDNRDLQRSPRHIQRFLHREQFLQHFAQLDGLQRIGAVGLRLFGSVVNFQEDAVHASGDRGPRENRDEFRLAATNGDAGAAVSGRG